MACYKAVTEVGLEGEGGPIVDEAEVVDLEQVRGCAGFSMFGKHNEKTLGRFSAAQRGSTICGALLDPETVEEF